MNPTASISARGTGFNPTFPCPPSSTADYCPPTGETVIIECNATGPYTITGKAGMIANNPLIIQNFQEELGGSYTCESTNVCGRGSDIISISFRGKLITKFKTFSHIIHIKVYHLLSPLNLQLPLYLVVVSPILLSLRIKMAPWLLDVVFVC